MNWVFWWAATAFGLPTAAGAAARALDKPDFSGDWVFNAEKSKLQIQVKLESATFTIDHKEPDFRFSLVFDVRIVFKDGREATNVVRYILRDGGRTFVAEEKFRGPALKYDNLWVADRKG